MENLSQRRAEHAFDSATNQVYKGANDGEVVKKIPAMIRQNGILGALAFAYENAAKTSHADVFRAIISHLHAIHRIEKEYSLEEFIKYLCTRDSLKLRAVTDEAMAYLNFLRRFAKKGAE